MSVQPSGPFEILEIPAVGAYGTIAVVRQTGQDGRVVAVKALRSSHLSRPRLMARARDEARMLYHLRHPNIVRVEELLDVGGRPVLLMEWVEGVSVQELLTELGTLPPLVAVELTRQAALALDAAYNTRNPDGSPMRIVHRDIKPANLLLSLAGELKVVDFGVAHGEFFDREATTMNTVMGTQGYMSPERMDGTNDIPAIDVYALGITLFQMLTGRMVALPITPKPHQEQLDGLVAEVRALELPEAPELAAGLAELLDRMLAWSPRKRPTTGELQMELASLLVRAEKRPDMVGFALAHAVPIHGSRPQIPPREHQDYPDLAFLEQPWETLEVEETHPREQVPTSFLAADPAADRRLRRFLATRGWGQRFRELTWLLARNPGWSATPFLEVLDAARRPWWQFWKPRPGPEELAQSLNMLRYRRSERVLVRAREFVGHTDPRVAESAERLLRNVE